MSTIFRCSLLALCFAGATGCDDFTGDAAPIAVKADANQKKPASKAGSQAQAPVEPGKSAEGEELSAVGAEDRASASGGLQAYATCAAPCYTESQTKKTDRATCKLNCKQELDTKLSKNPLHKGALAAVSEIDRHFDTCGSECKTEKSADDKATCMLTCTAEVGEKAQTMKLSTKPAAESPAPCAVACNARLEMCSGTCKKDSTLSKDNRATCNLECRNASASCLEACADKPE